MPNEVVAGLLLSVDAKTINARREIESLRSTMRESSRDIRAELAETRAGMKQIGEEIGINLNRHLISFLAKIPGADIFAKAFPIAAIVGVGGAFVEASKKLYEFIQRNDEAASKINEAFGSMHQASKLATDELAVTNDKLEEQIAKLTNQRPNTLKTMIDEARVSADKLVESIERSNKALDSLLKNKENQVSGLGGFFTNQVATGPAANEIQKQARDLADLAEGYQEMMGKAKTADEVKRIEAGERLALLSKEKEQLIELQRLYNTAKAGAEAGFFGQADVSAYQAIVGGRGHQLEDMIRSQEEEARHTDDDAKKKTIDQSSERLHDLEHQDEVRKIVQGKSVESEVLYWQRYIHAFTEGSNEWLAVNRKFQDAVVAMQKNFTDRGKLFEPLEKMRKEQAAPVPEAAQKDVGAEMMADFGHYGKSWEEYNRLVAENAQIHDKLQGALEGTSLRIAAETGQISREQAALREAEAQLAAYHAERREVRKEMSDVSGDTSLTEAQSATQLQQLRNKLDEITGQIDIKRAEAQALSDATKLRDSMAVMFNEWIRRSQDVRTQMTGLWDQFSSSMNDEMAKAITGARTNWSGAFRGVGESAVKMGLGNVEGLLMKHIHFPGGDKHMTPKMDVQAGVVTVNGPGGAGAPGMPAAGIDYAMPVASSNPMSTFLRTVGGLLGLVKPGGASVTAPVLPTSGSSWGDFDVPAMAFGGPVLAGHAYDIGEMGRERFVPGTDGHIVPNHALSDGGVFYQIDARGASAAEIEQRVSRAIARAHGSAVQNAVMVQQERRRRIPSRNM